MVERRKPIPVAEAISRLYEYRKYGEAEFVPIENCFGRFLGADIVATHPVPPFDRSPYDGYALRSMDTLQATREKPVWFEVKGTVGAGSVYPEKVGPFEAVRIMTGAQIPSGCDAVIMLEATKEIEKDGRTLIQIKKPIQKGTNISFAGEDTKKGTVLLKKGTYIHPGVTAILATFGYQRVPVSRKPKVGIIATGSELLEVDEELQPGKIRNSNAYMVYSQIIRAGGEPVYYGQTSDNLETCYRQVKNTLEEVDFLITTGGVSVGDYDYLPAIYERLGANVLFNKIKMRPGSVTTVAELDGKLLFGLSGNPSACFVGCELFVRPLIREFLGSTNPFLPAGQAVLSAEFPKPNPFTRFVRGYIGFEKDTLVAKPVGLDKSNAISSLGAANGFIVLQGGTAGYKKGTAVTVLFVESQDGQEFDRFIKMKF